MLWGQRIFDVTTYPFNVKHNGVTTDTVGLKKARDSAAIHSGTLYFPQGNYSAGTLIIPSNVEMCLDRGAIINSDIIVKGNINAGLYQIFSGTPNLDSAKILTVFPQWFGAHGDSIHDDTSPLQKCLNIKQDVFISQGIYFVTSLYLVNAEQRNIYGTGGNSKIIFTTNTSKFQIGDTINTGQANANYISKNFTLKNIYFGQRDSNYSVNYLRLTNLQSSKVSGVTIEASNNTGLPVATSTGIYVQGCNSVTLEDITISKFSGVAIHITKSQDIITSKILTNISGTGNNNMVVDTCGNGAITLSKMELLGGNYSLLMKNTNWSRISDSYFDSSEKGVYLTGHSTVISFNACWFSSRGYNNIVSDGLTIDTANGATIENCHFINNGRHGILLKPTSAFTRIYGNQILANNIADSSNGSGVYVSTGVSSFSIDNNTIANGIPALNSHMHYGVYIEGGFYDSYSITNNSISADDTAKAISDNGTTNAEKTIAGNKISSLNYLNKGYHVQGNLNVDGITRSSKTIPGNITGIDSTSGYTISGGQFVPPMLPNGSYIQLFGSYSASNPGKIIINAVNFSIDYLGKVTCDSIVVTKVRTNSLQISQMEPDSILLHGVAKITEYMGNIKMPGLILTNPLPTQSGGLGVSTLGNGLVTHSEAGFSATPDHSASWDADVSFPGFGTSHGTAAYGDHTHSSFDGYINYKNQAGVNYYITVSKGIITANTAGTPP